MRVKYADYGPPAEGAGPGWYPDPTEQRALHWWNGTAWTKIAKDATPASRAQPSALRVTDNARPRRRSSFWQGLKNVFNALFHIMAVSGANSDDPKFRRASQN